jgi:glycosyltransferase involved in cell wall biosynthesis
MNIAIDVSNTAGFRTGTEEYIEGLVYGLRRNGVHVVGVGRQTSALVPDKPHLGLELRRSPSPLSKWWWEYYGVRRVPKDVELVHIPFMAHPPARLSVPSVVTVHDLIPYRLAAYRKSIKERHYFSHIERSLPYADRLVAISHATFDDMGEFFPGLTAKTVVIPNGVHPDFFEDLESQQLMQTARRFGLRRHPRVLYVGGFDERKNVGTLLAAMKAVFSRHRDGELVLVGAKDNLAVRRSLVELGLENQVLVTPFVSRQDLVALYHGADVFVYPSRYEGFGLPPAQALAVGVPVIASDIPSVREVVQDYGVLVDPDSVEAWSAAIEQVLDAPETAHRMVTEGQDYAEEFSWPRIARSYLQLYHDALRGRS